MHRVPAGTFQRLSSPQGLWQAWLGCRRGKRRRPAIAAFDLDADRHCFALSRALRSGAYRPAPYAIQVVQDPKTRLIAAPHVRDRVVQTALLDTIGPSFERSFIDQSYAVCIGRGPQRAILEYLRCLRRFRWRLGLDIHHYFASVNHRVLLGLFARRLTEQRTLDLIARLLAAGGRVYQSPQARALPTFAADPVAQGCGLPLGGYLSHWSGGFYLDGLDHFVKRELKVRGYLRYMDDFVLFGDDPDRLEAIRGRVSQWLGQERRLRLKDPDAPVRSTRERSTFLGFRVSRAGVGLGPKARRRLKRALARADAMGTRRLIQVLRSYHGLIRSLGP
jgi:hypothetical protein